MVATKPRKRFWLKVAVGLAAGVLLFMALCPIWFPWLLQPILNRFQVTFASFQRVGGTELVLKDVNWHTPSRQLNVEELRVLTPNTWLWRHYIGTSEGKTWITADNWKLRIDPTAHTTQAPSQPASITNVLERVASYMPTVQSWLPAARLSSGEFEVGSNTFAVPAVNWSNGKLDGQVQWKGRTLTVEAAANDALYQLDAKLSPDGADASLNLQRTLTGWSAEGSMRWATNQAEFAATFDQEGTLPTWGFLVASNWTAPTHPLDGYAPPVASLSLVWTNLQLSVTLDAVATPLDSTLLPPIDVRVDAAANPQGIRIEQLSAATPWLTAELSSPIALTTAGELLSGESTFDLHLNLDNSPVPGMRGHVSGALRLRAGATRYPAAELQLRGTDLGFREFNVPLLRVEGDVAWPECRVTRLDITVGETSLSAAGQLDLETLTLHDASWDLNGKIPLLPEGYKCAGVSARGRFAGELRRLTHSGTIQARSFESPETAPTDWTGEWQGDGPTLTLFRIEGVAGSTHIVAAGAGSYTNVPLPSVALRLDRLDLQSSDRPIHRLTHPTSLWAQFPTRSEGGTTPFILDVGAFEWTNAVSRISARGQTLWPQQGALALFTTNLSLGTFQGLLRRPLPSLTLNTLSLDAAWTNGALRSDLSFGVAYAPESGPHLTAVAEVTGTSSGFSVRRGTISSSNGPIAHLDGKLPLVIQPGSAETLWKILNDEPVDLRVMTTSNPALWQRITRISGLGLGSPAVRLEVSGTPRRPRATVTAQADRIELRGWTNQTVVPVLDGVSLQAAIREDAIDVTHFEFRLADQAARLTSHLPLPDDFWTQPLELFQSTNWWQNASGHARIDHADLAALGPFLPTLVSPVGTVDLDVAIQPGLNFDGTLRLTNAASSAIASVGAVREIGADIRLRGRTAVIERFTGTLGGRTVQVTGTVGSPDLGFPEFELSLKGARIPLVRRSGLLVRADLDLQARTQRGPSPDSDATTPSVDGAAAPQLLITGSITPRDSLFLQDLNSLIPRGLAQAQRRPPYFRVETPPVSAWLLDVRIKGERFLRVRTPLFRGELSMDMELKGPLRDPIAVGEVRVDQGRLIFPFCNMNVSQGLVDLSSENPFEPHLLVTASARAFGYTVRMEATGDASNPALVFTSTPPLTSEEILLMITAGELPQNEVTFSRTEKASRLATMLGKDLLARVTGREDSADRLTIRSGENISEQGKLTYYLEYRLTDKWSLVGESDRFNALNAGVKWRLYSR